MNPKGNPKYIRLDNLLVFFKYNLNDEVCEKEITDYLDL